MCVNRNLHVGSTLNCNTNQFRKSAKFGNNCTLAFQVTVSQLDLISDKITR